MQHREAIQRPERTPQTGRGAAWGVRATGSGGPGGGVLAWGRFSWMLAVWMLSWTVCHFPVTAAEPWWSIGPLRDTRLPEVRDASWARSPIDRFVQARREAAGDSMSAEADRATLLRRASYTLTGLPPTPAEMQAFVADSRPDAYNRAVDRLLQSPRYGEHQGRLWLDVARYGDTHGLHLDNLRSLWPYRAWVIDALNSNQPFDQFTRDQLAGDLLPNATLAQQVATGFLRCNVTTSEEGSIPQEFLVRYAMDRTETAAAAWMGLTLQCAACHDHKYDPITQPEYYRMFAYFYQSADAAMDGNAPSPAPSVRVPEPPQEARWRAQRRRREALEKEWDGYRRLAETRLPEWIAEWESARSNARAERSPRREVWSCACDEIMDGRVRCERGEPGRVAGDVVLDTGPRDGALRLNAGPLDGQAAIDFGDAGDLGREASFTALLSVYSESTGRSQLLGRSEDSPRARGWSISLEDQHVVVRLVHDGEPRSLEVRMVEPLVRGKWHRLAVSWDGSGRAAGVRVYREGVSQELTTVRDQLDGPWDSPGRLRAGGPAGSVAGGAAGTAFVGMLDDLRLCAPSLEEAEIRAEARELRDPIARLLAVLPVERTEAQRERLLEHFLARQLPEAIETQRALRNADQQLRQLEGQFATTLVMRELERPREVRVLAGGHYDQPGDRVTPGVPGFLPPLPEDAPANRLALARWLTNECHPLTARVAVNRAWQQHFGEPLVDTPEDFGTRGSPPSHPELLDWLAADFVRSGWDLKHLHRRIVTSATFRQSSRASREAYAGDPRNRQLARGPRYRLDAEVLRDSALLSSGLLVERLGGPSGKVYQPEGIWEAIGYSTSNTRVFVQDHGGALYRRGLYTFWKRTAPPPAMQLLDAPSREVCTLRRQRTNTPTAALVLMNDVQFVEAARKLAERMLRETPADASDDDRIDYLFRWVPGRAAEPRERSRVRQLVGEFRDDYRRDTAAAQRLVAFGEAPRDLPRKTPVTLEELAAWTMVANTLMNLDEALHQW